MQQDAKSENAIHYSKIVNFMFFVHAFIVLGNFRNTLNSTKSVCISVKYNTVKGLGLYNNCYTKTIYTENKMRLTSFQLVALLSWFFSFVIYFNIP